MTTAIERLIAARPGRYDDDRWHLRIGPEQLAVLEARWDDAEDASMPWWIGPELSRDAGGVHRAGYYESESEGRHAVVLYITAHEVANRLGTCNLGTIARVDQYLFGASLAALAAGGVALSWAAAGELYAAARATLAVEFHVLRRLHGRLAPHRVRLAVFHRPYSGIDTEDPAPPIVLAGGDLREADDAGMRAELATLAGAVIALTTHPDPVIHRLLRDPEPSAITVLRDALLAREAPIDDLLGDRIGDRQLPRAAAEPAPAIHDELVELWQRVFELDPMLAP